MKPARALPLLAALLLTGCGGGTDTATRTAAAPATTTRPTPPTPSTPPVRREHYLRALTTYCRATTRALDAFVTTPEDKRDPIRPLAVLAGRYRTGLERLGQITPPAAYRTDHLLTLATGRETAARLDDGVRLGRQGDIGAATSALNELSDLLPTFTPTLRRAAPACAPKKSGR